MHLLQNSGCCSVDVFITKVACMLPPLPVDRELSYFVQSYLLTLVGYAVSICGANGIASISAPKSCLPLLCRGMNSVVCEPLFRYNSYLRSACLIVGNPASSRSSVLASKSSHLQSPRRVLGCAPSIAYKINHNPVVFSHHVGS